MTSLVTGLVVLAVAGVLLGCYWRNKRAVAAPEQTTPQVDTEVSAASTADEAAQAPAVTYVIERPARAPGISAEAQALARRFLTDTYGHQPGTWEGDTAIFRAVAALPVWDSPLELGPFLSNLHALLNEVEHVAGVVSDKALQQAIEAHPDAINCLTHDLHIGREEGWLPRWAAKAWEEGMEAVILALKHRLSDPAH